MKPIVFIAYAANGAPLAGLSPVWYCYYNADTGAPTVGPSISDLGLGSYKFTPATVYETGIIDLGATAFPRYVFYPAHTIASFAAYDNASLPLPGLIGIWNSTFRDVSGVPLTEPTVTELGSGVYKIVPNSTTRGNGVLDLGSSASPRYLAYDSDQRPAIVATPAAIGPSQAITITVTDDGSAFSRLLLMVELAGQNVKEIAYDGTGFGPMYRNGLNMVTPVAGGYTFTLLRDGGWPSSPTVTPFAIDLDGFENA